MNDTLVTLGFVSLIATTVVTISIHALRRPLPGRSLRMQHVARYRGYEFNRQSRLPSALRSGDEDYPVVGEPPPGGLIHSDLTPVESDTRFRNVMRGTQDGKSFTAGDLGYGGEGATRWRTIVWIHLEKALPRVNIESISPIEDLPDRAAGAEVNLESDAFNRAFRVTAAEKIDVQTLLDQQVMEWLMRAHPCDVNVETGPFGVVAFDDSLVAPNKLADFIDDAVTLAHLIPSFAGIPRRPRRTLGETYEPHGWTEPSGFLGFGGRSQALMTPRGAIHNIRTGRWSHSPATRRYVLVGLGGYEASIIPMALIMIGYAPMAGAIGSVLLALLPFFSPRAYESARSGQLVKWYLTFGPLLGLLWLVSLAIR